MQIGDIILTLGKYKTSQLIASITKEDGEGYSHASIIVAESPLPLILESVPPRAHVITLEQSLSHAKKATLLSPLNISNEDRLAIVKAALQVEGKLYGLHRFVGFLADEILNTDWCAQHLGLGKAFPICSVTVAAAYATRGLNFGEDAYGVNPSEMESFAQSHPHLYAMKELL